MIYVLEGPDGVGKTTLAYAIQEKTKGHILHCTWNEKWVMRDYFEEIMETAKQLDVKQDVVIDRWAPSEYVYGNVFRGGPQFDIFEYLKNFEDDDQITWVMCKNPNAVANHLKHMKKREEMFNDMTDVVANFSLFAADTPELNWLEYDYTKIRREDWVDEHISRRQ